MGTNTTNYSFSKPTVDGDEDSWGTQLNGNWDKTDSLLSGGQDISSLSITTSVTLKGQADLVLKDADSSHSVSLQAPATIGTNFTLTLPAADGSSGQVIQTDGSGNLSFVDQSGGGGSGDSIADADGDTKVEVEASSDNDAIIFTTAGSEAGRFTASNLLVSGSTTADSGFVTGHASLSHQTDSTWRGLTITNTGDDNECAVDGKSSDGTQQFIVYGGAQAQGFLNPSTYGWRLKIPLSGSFTRDNTHTIWDSGNDGSGSGLDADTLDGLESTSFLRSDASDAFTGSEFTIDNELIISNGDGTNTHFNYNNGGSENYIRGSRLDIDVTGITSISYNGADALNFDGTGAPDSRGISFNSRTALSADDTDGYLRLNDGSEFTNGVYTPANFRVDGVGLFLGQARSHNGWRNNNSVDTNITYGVSFSTSAPSDSNGYNLLRESGSWTSPYPDIRMNAHTGFNMRANNNYDGVRIFRDYNDNNRIIQFNGSSNYIFKDVWMHITTAGFYSSTNGMHLYPNSSTNYGSTAITGSRGSYGGLLDNYSGVHFMHDSAGNGGNYRQSTGRWYFYHHVGNNCTGFSSSTTSSSYTIYSTGAIYSTGNITAYSDARMKENIVTIDSALDKVCAMRGVYYNKIDDETKARQVGVIAQEMLEPEACPEAVTYAEDVDEYGVSYGNLVGVLIEAIKELRQEVAELKGN